MPWDNCSTKCTKSTKCTTTCSWAQVSVNLEWWDVRWWYHSTCAYSCLLSRTPIQQPPQMEHIPEISCKLAFPPLATSRPAPTPTRYASTPTTRTVPTPATRPAPTPATGPAPTPTTRPALTPDIKHRVWTHNGTSNDIHVYIDHVLQLLKSENPDEFEERLSFSSKWSKGFLEYFESWKHEIMRCATRYNIEPLEFI